MTLKELLLPMQADEQVSIWGGPNGLDLVDRGTVAELVLGDDEDLPTLDSDVLGCAVVHLTAYQTVTCPGGVVIAITIDNY